MNTMPPKKTQPVDLAADLIAKDCLAVRVRMLNRTITAIYDEALRPLGLTTGQLNILVIVTKRGPMSPGDVAWRFNMEKSTVSRNVQRMRKNGWLTVTESGSGRNQEQTLLEKSVPVGEEAQTRARAVLGRGGAASIHSVANAVWSRIGR